MQDNRQNRCQRYVLALGAVLACWPGTSWACAICWAGDDALARALNASIVFLMAMPFVIGGTIIGVLYVAQKHSQGQRWPYIGSKHVAWTQKENAQ